MEKKLKSEFQRIKVSNSLAVGGMIGAGKSTLSRALGETLKVNVVYELNKNDELQDVLLKRLYEGDKTASITFQIYFFCTRFEKYREMVQRYSRNVFDRTIFEDRLFAHQNMTADPVVFGFYDSMWRDKVTELIYSVGMPKLYVILDLKWDEFTKRLFERGRQSEIANFSQNELYFRSLLNIYKEYLTNVCQTYGINYLILDATLPTEQQVNLVMKELQKNKSLA